MRTWITRLALSLFVVVGGLLAATAPHSTSTAHSAMPSNDARDRDQETPTPTSPAPPSASISYRMEAEAMTLVGSAANPIRDPEASGGVAVKAWRNSSGVGGSATFSTSGTYAFTFGGREDY
ncbi:MAG TPA: hypothetical protein VKF37_06005, partial [Chloroflexota bacterium]|nr:hypothetical protein [Chloroflexota bacterium]